MIRIRNKNRSYILGGCKMSGISRDQKEKDEATLSVVLVFFNIALFGALLIANIYLYII